MKIVEKNPTDQSALHTLDKEEYSEYFITDDKKLNNTTKIKPLDTIIRYESDLINPNPKFMSSEKMSFSISPAKLQTYSDFKKPLLRLETLESITLTNQAHQSTKIDNFSLNTIEYNDIFKFSIYKDNEKYSLYKDNESIFSTANLEKEVSDRNINEIVTDKEIYYAKKLLLTVRLRLLIK